MAALASRATMAALASPATMALITAGPIVEPMRGVVGALALPPWAQPLSAPRWGLRTTTALHADMRPIRRAIRTHAKAFGVAADDDLIRTALSSSSTGNAERVARFRPASAGIHLMIGRHPSAGRYSSPSAPNNPNCAGSRAGSGRPRWRKACPVISRPRGVRCNSPHWIR
jgi:hypothetical protein